MADRYPGYDVLAKRDSPSWNEQTRGGDRPAARHRPRPAPLLHRRRMGDAESGLRAHRAAAAPIAPRRVPLAAMVDEKLMTNATDGYRDARLPPLRRGVAARARGARRRSRGAATAAGSTPSSRAGRTAS